jgi:2-oxoisovalerate dehydrogenase E2 component (dihydrolipoyl transacylase)
VSVYVIKVPDIGEGIAEVELVAWHVKPGDLIAEDQALADVMTDKATVEIPSPVIGRVLALGGEVGQVLAVGAELIRIERDSASQPAAGAAASVAPAPPPLAQRSAAYPGSPSARSTEPARAALRDRPIASPAVRARAWELGVDLKDVPASGPAGRIMRADLDAYAASSAAPAAPRAQPTAHESSLPGATRTVKIVGLRRRIAQKMQESKRRIPHYTYVEEVDVSELEDLRSQLNAKWGEQRAHLTLLPFLIRAIVLAVREFPQVNARFDDDTGVLTVHEAVHVGIATQTDEGLMVPVLRDAQARDLWSSATEVARLAQAARSGKVLRDELSGSTITITSLGRLGGIMSTPVINHPEVAIVGVNRIAVRPVMMGGAVVARQLMNLSSSFDHRVIDGAHAAGFVQGLRNHLEHPAALSAG